MPLFKPDIQAALREAGLVSEKDATISERLDSKGMTLDDSLELLTDLAHAAGNENIKLRAIETSLKLRGVLKEQAAPPPSITIVINDPSGTTTNPILLPRELSASLLNTKKESIQ